MKKNCRNCKYWDSSVFVDGDVEIGECRRKPPKLSMKMALEQNNSEISCLDEAHWLATVFPITSDETWCGEWKKKAEQDGNEK